MKELLFTIILITSVISGFSQNQFIKTEGDSDRYNHLCYNYLKKKIPIYKEPSKTSEIVSHIKTKSFFYYQPLEDNNWAKASLNWKDQGYIKQSLKYVHQFTYRKKKKITLSILEKLRPKYSEYQEDLKNNQNVDYDKWNNYLFTKYFTTLNIAEKLICRQNDPEILKQFIENTYATRKAAWEAPVYTLTNIFMCQMQSVVRAINNTHKPENLYQILKIGFKMRSNDKQQYDRYIEKVDELMESSSGK